MVVDIASARRRVRDDARAILFLTNGKLDARDDRELERAILAVESALRKDSPLPIVGWAFRRGALTAREASRLMFAASQSAALSAILLQPSSASHVTRLLDSAKSLVHTVLAKPVSLARTA